MRQKYGHRKRKANSDKKLITSLKIIGAKKDHRFIGTF